MKPKERRDRLFKTSRPNIREMELFGESGFGKDMGILWAAYQRGTFGDNLDVSQEDFARTLVNEVDQYQKRWMIEDKNSQFAEGEGPIGMMAAVYNGWELEPHFDAFEWATPRNILRAIVSFLQMMRYDRSVGVVNVYTLNKDKNFFKHVTEYGVLRYLGKIPDGDERGDRHIFYTRGRKDGRRS